MASFFFISFSFPAGRSSSSGAAVAQPSSGVPSSLSESSSPVVSSSSSSGVPSRRPRRRRRSHRPPPTTRCRHRRCSLPRRPRDQRHWHAVRGYEGVLIVVLRGDPRGEQPRVHLVGEADGLRRRPPPVRMLYSRRRRKVSVTVWRPRSLIPISCV